jgi:hypothetical protein
VPQAANQHVILQNQKKVFYNNSALTDFLKKWKLSESQTTGPLIPRAIERKTSITAISRPPCHKCQYNQNLVFPSTLILCPHRSFCTDRAPFILLSGCVLCIQTRSQSTSPRSLGDGNLHACNTP